MRTWMESQSARAVAGLLLACLGLSAGSPTGGRRPPAHPGLPQGSAPTTGAIEGRVIFQGAAIPKSTEIENGTDPEVCGKRQSFGDLIISAQNSGIQNVIISLAEETVPPTPRPAAEKLVIDNHICQFSPHAAVLTTGSTVEATNSDAVFHTTHLYYGALSRNLALAKGDRMNQLVSRPGMILVKCDIHGWMKAYVRVDRHPFHAVSDASGRFAIRGLPAGTYTLEVWHETLGKQRVPVTVARGKTERIELQYRN